MLPQQLPAIIQNLCSHARFSPYTVRYCRRRTKEGSSKQNFRTRAICIDPNHNKDKLLCFHRKGWMQSMHEANKRRIGSGYKALQHFNRPTLRINAQGAMGAGWKPLTWLSLFNQVYISSLFPPPSSIHRPKEGVREGETDFQLNGLVFKRFSRTARETLVPFFTSCFA